MKRTILLLALASAVLLAAAGPAAAQTTPTHVTGTFKTPGNQTPTEAGLKKVATISTTAVYGSIDFEPFDSAGNRPVRILCGGITYVPQPVRAWIKGDATMIANDATAGVDLIPTAGCTPSGLVYRATIKLSGSTDGRLPGTVWSEQKQLPAQTSVDWGALAVAGISALTYTGYNSILDEAAALAARNTVNFTGAGVTCTDDAGNLRTNCAISGTAGPAYATVQEEGAALAQRASLNFIGTAVTCVDNAGAARTDCTVTGGGGSVPTGTGFRHVTAGAEDAAAKLVANADVDAAAAIVDSKLAQIATAAKVSGAALTSLASVPAGAGQIPLANLPFGTANQLYKTNAGATAIEQATLTAGTAGTDFAVAFAAGSITLNLPTASATVRGALASADWTTFNNKVPTSRTLTGGAGIAAIGDLSADRTIATASGEADFLASGALICGASTQGKMQVHTTPLQYCDNAATPTLRYGAYGDSAGAALSGDSATAFFIAGQIEPARGGTGLDTSASTGVLRISAGTWSANAGISHLASSTSSDLLGVLSDETGSGAAVFAASPTLTGTITINRRLEFTEAAGDPTCAAGDYWISVSSTTSTLRKCQNGSLADLDTGGAGGDNISVNGTAATDADFDDATPAAPANAINVKWQKDALSPNNLSAYVPYAAPLTVATGNLTCPTCTTSAAAVTDKAVVLGSGGSQGLVALALPSDSQVYQLTQTSGANPVWALPGIPVNAQVGTTYTVLTTDRGNLITTSNAAAIAVTLPQANSAGFAGNFFFALRDLGAGTATITPTTSTINGAASLAVPTGQTVYIYSNNTNYFAAVVPALPATKANLPATTVYTDQANTFGAFAQDFEGASVTRPFRRLAFASFPATCTANREFLERSDPAVVGQVLYVCNSTANGWDLVGDGGSGSGITTLNTLTATTQTFAKVDDTNVTLGISSATSTHTFTMGWTGTLAKSRTLGTTVYTDQANTFGAFVQTFQAGVNHLLVDPTDTTKKFQFDASNIATATTRTINVPNANSTLAQAFSAPANQFLTAISAQGVFSAAQVGISNLATSTSADLLAVLSDETGTGKVVFHTSPTLITPEIGTVAAPASPGAGLIRLYADSTDLRIHDKNASGVIGTTVVSDAGAANNFLIAVSAAGVISKAQPSFANLSGSATGAQLPATAVQTNQTNTYSTGTQDFESTTVSRPFRRLAFASFPGTCTANREFLERSDPATAGQVVYVCNAAGTGWDLVGDGGSGGGSSWNAITNPTAAQALTMGANNTTWTWDSLSGVFKSSHTSAFTTGPQFLIEQITGNPTGGTLFEVRAADADVIAAKFGDGTGYTRVNKDGSLEVNVGTEVVGFIDFCELAANGTDCLGFVAPTTAIATADAGRYEMAPLPSAAGFLRAGARASNLSILTVVGETGSGSVVRAVSPTNVTLDAEGTGNAITIPTKIWIPAATCVAATAALNWDDSTEAKPAAACITGTNTSKAVADFVDTATNAFQTSILLPSTWTGTVDARFFWFTTVTTNSVVWQIATVCVGDAATDDPAFNTASTVTDVAKGTASQMNIADITGVTITGCAASQMMHVKILRDPANASDTLAATARLYGVELTMRNAW